MELPDKNILYYCTDVVSGRPFGLTEHDRFRHVYVLGKTGVGKSTLLRNMLVQDFQAGRGCALLDPHGDLADELLDHIPRHRTRDVVYFAPADIARPIGFNVLEQVEADKRAIVADGVVSAFKHIWHDSWGPRLEHYLYNTTAALLDTPGSTLLGIPRMLTDADFRERIVRRVQDPIVRAFWEQEFGQGSNGFTAEAISPVLNKVGRFLAAPAVRNIIGQPTSTIDFRFMMDTGRIFIANLSKGLLGEEHANLLGALLVTKFHLAAMSRAEVPSEDRFPFHLFVDEFQNYATESFATILSEARKYALSLTISHQHTSQTPPSIRDAILGNAGTLIVFRTGSPDAELIGNELGNLRPDALTDLSSFEIWTRPLLNGEQVHRFPAKTMPPLDTHCGRRDTITMQSRERFGRDRVKVEDRIERFLGLPRGRGWRYKL